MVLKGINMARYNQQDQFTTSGFNTENQKVETAINDTLSRKGDTPNEMLTDIDMNSNRILNLVDAENAREPVTLGQFNNTFAGNLGKNTKVVSHLKLLGGVTPDAISLYFVAGFYAGTEVGGGQFIYDASRDKADHNGGTVITPEAIAAWDGTQAGLSVLLDWTGTGTGAFVREDRGFVDIADFGGVGSGDDRFAMVAALSQNDYAVIFSKDYTATSAGDIQVNCARVSGVTVTGRKPTLKISGSSGSFLLNSGNTDRWALEFFTFLSDNDHSLEIVDGTSHSYTKGVDVLTGSPDHQSIRCVNPISGLYSSVFELGIFGGTGAGGGNGRTVPLINLESDGPKINENEFRNCWTRFSGLQKAIRLVSTSASGYLTNNNFNTVTFEVANGGGVYYKGTQNTCFKNVSFWDATQDYAGHLIEGPDNSDTGLFNRGTTIINMARFGNQMAAGFYDFEAGRSQDTVIINTATLASLSPTFNYGTRSGTVIGGGSVIGSNVLKLQSRNLQVDNLDVLGNTITENSGDMYLNAQGNIQLRPDGIETAYVATNNGFYGGNGAFLAFSDNTRDLGSSGFRWKDIYAANGTIQTSDRDAKQQIKDIDSAVLRAWGKVNFVQYKLNESVEQKGEDARIHFGVIAQDVKSAFESEGLDPFEYGLLCYNDWPDLYETKKAVFDEDGNEIEPEKEVLIKSAGSSYGVRYQEALVLECAYLRAKLDGTL